MEIDLNPPPPKKSKAGLILILLIAFGLFLLFGGTSLMRRHFPAMGKVFPAGASGTVTSTGPSGTWTMHVDHCQSGAPRQYFGIGFFDSSDSKLGGRVVLPESGPAHVSVNVPDAPDAIGFDRDACSVWDADIQNTATRYNGVRALKGHARFDCRDAAGAHIQGDLQFRSCH